MGPARRCQTASASLGAHARLTDLRRRRQTSTPTLDLMDLRGASPAVPLARARTERSTRGRTLGLDTVRFPTPPPTVLGQKRSRRSSPLNRSITGAASNAMAEPLSSAVSRSPSPVRQTPVRTRESHGVRGHSVHANEIRTAFVPDMLGAIVTGHPDLGRRGERRRQDLGADSASCGRLVDGPCHQRGRWRPRSGGGREHLLEAARRSWSPACGMVDR